MHSNIISPSDGCLWTLTPAAITLKMMPNHNSCNVFSKNPHPQNKHNKPTVWGERNKMLHIKVKHETMLHPKSEELHKDASPASQTWKYHLLFCMLPRNQELPVYFHKDGYMSFKDEENRTNLSPAWNIALSESLLVVADIFFSILL